MPSQPNQRIFVKFLLDNWMLISVALSSGALLLWPVLAGGARAGSLSPADAVQRINREKAVVIDVGEPHEFAAGHVIGAKNVPFGQLEDKLPSLVKNKAVGVAKKLGFEQAQSIAGGLKGWRDASLPVEKA